MTPNKIERIEEATWEDPIFTFVIERHGRTVHGSSRAELQRWTVDLDAGTATTAASHSHRQLTPPAVDALYGSTRSRNRKIDAGVDDLAPECPVIALACEC
jgi:hypothetical protein